MYLPLGSLKSSSTILSRRSGSVSAATMYPTAWHRFSKVSALVHFLYKVTIETTFQKVHTS